MIARSQSMTVREIRFARCLLMSPRAVVGTRLSMVLRSVRKMLGLFSVMLNCFGRHTHASSEIASAHSPGRRASRGLATSSAA